MLTTADRELLVSQLQIDPDLLQRGGIRRVSNGEGREILGRNELTAGFGKWFDAWNTDKSGELTEEQLRDGINQEFNPFRGGGPQGAPPGPQGPPPGR